MTISTSTYRSARQAMVADCRQLRAWIRHDPDDAKRITSYLKIRQHQMIALRLEPRSHLP